MISPSEAKFDKIANRFHTSEEDRIARLARDKIFIDEFISVMMPHIKFLYNNSMRFYVLKIDTNSVPCTMNAGIFPCCGTDVEVSDAMRKMTEEEITSKTRFKRIIWEDLQ